MTTDIQQLQAENTALRARIQKAIDALIDAQGEWAPVDTVYCPSNI